MRKIECVVQNAKLTELAEALRIIGIGGVTISEVKGFGNERTRPENYLFLPKTKVEVYVNDGQVNEVVAAIISTCRTGNLGDGKIAILPLDEIIRVRTGEKGKVAV
jgi:nitrogen regulatory protein P-II 1